MIKSASLPVKALVIEAYMMFFDTGWMEKIFKKGYLVFQITLEIIQPNKEIMSIKESLAQLSKK